MNNQVRFIDTTVRDGNQSLWALNMKIGSMLPALAHMDEAGFESMEFFLERHLQKICPRTQRESLVLAQRRH